MKMWNEFDYITQAETMNFLNNFKRKAPSHLKEAVGAAIAELEMWANTPCPELEVDEEGHAIVVAQTPYGDS